MMTLKEFSKKYKSVKSPKFVQLLGIAKGYEKRRKSLTELLELTQDKRTQTEDALAEVIDKLYIELERLGKYKFPNA